MSQATSRSRIPAALAVAIVCMVAMVGVYWWSVRTPAGQRLDIAGMLGSRLGSQYVGTWAERVLDMISTVTVAAAVIAVIVIAVVRKRPALAAGAVLLVLGANATTQILKKFVFTRPDLGITDVHSNSLPSGHTTVAASIAMALVLAVGTRARPWVSVVAALYSAGIGLATMILGWHRPSDVVAALLISAAWAAVVVAIGAAWESGVTIARGSNASVGTAIVMCLLGAVLLAVMVIVAAVITPSLPAGHIGSTADLTHTQTVGAYAVAFSAIVGTSLLVFGVLVALVPRSRGVAQGA